MGEDYGYQDPEVEIKESGDVDFVEFTDSIADGKDHSVTFYDIAPEGSVMLVYNYDHAQDKLEVISYDEKWLTFEENLYRIICRRLKDILSSSDWKILNEIIQKNNTDTFSRVANSFE